MAGEKKILFSFLSAFFILLFILACFSEGTYETGDSIQHFLISKFAFKHPELFVDHWGKPFFTLVSSPFSRFGFIGINTFNILCAVTTAYFTWLIAKKLNLSRPLFTPLFVLFTPVYLVTLISGLTEPFFGLLLMASIYLTMLQRYLFSALLISFLPFVRSEGNLILLLFTAVFVIRKKWTSIPLLAFGTIAYSIAGWFHYHDLLWIIHQNPYTNNKNIYGHGELFHFVSNNEFILGLPLVIMFLLGLISWWRKTNTSAEISSLKPEEFILVYGSFFLYFIAHSVFWWKGIYGSLGLIRVLAGITPCAALICLRGFNFFLHFLERWYRPKQIFIVVFSTLVIWTPFRQHIFPRPLKYEEATIKEAAGWMKKNYYQGRKTYYLFPYLAVFLNLDPFDTSKAEMLWSVNKINPAAGMPQGSIVVWDEHFTPNEGGLPLAAFNDNPDFKLLMFFKADPVLIPGDKKEFQVYLFERK